MTIKTVLQAIRGVFVASARTATIATASAVLIATPFVAQWEGVKPVPYADRLAGGLMTVCAGETRVAMRVYSHAECMAMLESALTENLTIVRASVKVATAPEMDAAFISFIHNVGPGAFRSSAALRAVNAGDYAAACRALAHKDFSSGVCRGYGCGWASGKMVKGLQNRRLAERDLCLKGVPQ